jgi:hypothetical protein
VAEKAYFCLWWRKRQGGHGQDKGREGKGSILVHQKYKAKKKEHHPKNHPKKNKEVVMNTIKQVPSEEKKSKFLPRKKADN